MDDPEKRFYPIVSLPTPITQQLLYARKYIFSFFNDCVVLCNMGLLSIGPQIMKEKDKVESLTSVQRNLLIPTLCKMWLVSIEPQIMKVYSQGRLINDLCIVKPVYTDTVTWGWSQ